MAGPDKPLQVVEMMFGKRVQGEDKGFSKQPALTLYLHSAGGTDLHTSDTDTDYCSKDMKMV